MLEVLGQQLMAALPEDLEASLKKLFGNATVGGDGPAGDATQAPDDVAAGCRPRPERCLAPAARPADRERRQLTPQGTTRTMDQLTTQPFDDDKLHEECGVFGVFGHPDAAALTALGLHALQHRGQEAAGIVSFDGDRLPRRAPCRPGRRQLHPAERGRPACPATAPSATTAIRPMAARSRATSSRSSPSSPAAASRSPTTAT